MHACTYRKKPEEIYIVNLFAVWDQRNNTEKGFHFIYPYIVWTLYNNHALLLKLTEEISRFKSQLGLFVGVETRAPARCRLTTLPSWTLTPNSLETWHYCLSEVSSKDLPLERVSQNPFPLFSHFGMKPSDVSTSGKYFLRLLLYFLFAWWILCFPPSQILGRCCI